MTSSLVAFNSVLFRLGLKADLTVGVMWIAATYFFTGIDILEQMHNVV